MIEQRAVELRKEGKKWVEIGDELGISRDSARRAYSRGLRMDTFPLVMVKPTDMKRWAAKTDWTTVLSDLKDGILADIRHESACSTPLPPGAPDGAVLLEISPADLHVGKLSWREETGVDYDIRLAERAFTSAVQQILADAGRWSVGKIVLVVGNDLLQTDNLAGTTTAGTYVDTDSRYIKSFRRARRLQSWAIRQCAKLAPVHVVIVPGNHDRLTAFHLGEVLEAEFADDPNVTVDNSPRLRKYFRWGVNLLGFTHGSEEKMSDLPLIMATECPQDWSETLHREFHVGHLHKSKETRFTAGDSFNGVRVRVLPSLCAPDAWHFARGYVGETRACEAYLWSESKGYKGHLSASADTLGHDAKPALTHGGPATPARSDSGD